MITPSGNVGPEGQGIGALAPPRLRLIAGDEGFAQRLRGVLTDFPVLEEDIPAAFNLPKDALHVWVVPSHRAEAFTAAALATDPDAQVLLQSSVIVSASSISDRERVKLYELGFAFVHAGDDAFEVLQGRLWSMLRTRSRVLTEQILNHRLRARLASQSGHIENQQNFLYMAVHDLRGPLSAMICYAELLMEGVLGNLQQSQLEPIRTIHRSCQFMIDMVTDLLDSAKIEAGKLSLKLEKASFQSEVETTMASLKGLADSKNITVESVFESIPDMYLDIQKVSRILSNLLGNAIKFTRNGGRISLRTLKQNNTLVFSIQDTGPGISPQDLDSIFDRFNTASGSVMSGKGHGLGLAISKSFVELHGGRIFVESTRHRGSVFVVHLPIEKRRSGALRQGRRKVLVLDLAHDIPDLANLGQTEGSDLDFQFVASTPEAWNSIALPPSDLLLINEPSQLGALGHDYHLLALGSMSTERRSAILVHQDLRQEEKETRKLLGYTLLEKPCNLSDLFHTLQAIFGQDRRQQRSA